MIDYANLRISKNKVYWFEWNADRLCNEQIVKLSTIISELHRKNPYEDSITIEKVFNQHSVELSLQPRGFCNCDYEKIEETIADDLHHDADCISHDMLKAEAKAIEENEDKYEWWWKGFCVQRGIPISRYPCDCTLRVKQYELSLLDHHVDCPVMKPMIYVPTENIRIQFALLPFDIQYYMNIDSHLMIYSNRKMEREELSMITESCLSNEKIR